LLILLILCRVGLVVVKDWYPNPILYEESILYCYLKSNNSDLHFHLILKLFYIYYKG